MIPPLAHKVEGLGAFFSSCIASRTAGTPHSAPLKPHPTVDSGMGFKRFLYGVGPSVTPVVRFTGSRLGRCRAMGMGER